MRSNISISTAPYLKDTPTTKWIMYQVVLTLIPIVIASIYYFGFSVLLVIIASILGCVAVEKVFVKSSLTDGSTLLTGLLLGLTLPPGMPLWMAFLGGVAAIGMGKILWGGLGQNAFNPALVGRAFLQTAFPTAISTWSLPDGSYFQFRGTNLALPLFKTENVEGVSSATPLAKMKFENIGTDTVDLLVGNTSGSIGETVSILIVMAGIYLIIIKVINWRIPYLFLSQ